MKYILSIFVISIICGCDILKSHSKYILENKDEICSTICSQPIDTETNVLTKDTIYTTIDNTYLGADSMMISLYMYCDSNNNVLIKNSELLQSKYGRMILTHNKDVYTIRALYDSIEIKNKTIHEIKTNTVTVTTKVPVYVEKKVEVRYIPFWIYCVFTLSGVVIVWLGIKNIRL